MDKNKKLLADLLAEHMKKAHVGDSRLASHVNKIFPELKLSRSTIRNWRQGVSSRAKNWMPVAAIAMVLKLDEQEAGDLLAAAGWKGLHSIWQQIEDKSNKKYLEPWISNLESADEVPATAVSISQSINQPDADAANSLAEVSIIQTINLPDAAAANSPSYRLLAVIVIFMAAVGLTVWFATRTEATTLTAVPIIVTPVPADTVVPATAIVEQTAVSTSSPPPQSTPTTTLNDQLQGGDFEEKDDIAHWQSIHGCGLQVYYDGEDAIKGESYLMTTDIGDECHSIYQDIYNQPEPGETYYLSFWVKSDNDLPWPGEVTIWTDDNALQEHAGTIFLGNDKWQCVETSLSAAYQHVSLRTELYFRQPGENIYYIDDVRLEKTPQCPAANLEISKLDLLGTGQLYANASIGMNIEISNNGLNLLPAKELHYWIAETENGEPINGESALQLVPYLSPAEQFAFSADFYLPVNISEGEHFLVFEPRSTIAPIYIGDRSSFPLHIQACASDNLYCDVLPDYWAWPAIENFYDQGISKGCRSGTEPYVNRPFCPDKRMDYWSFIIFTLRYVNMDAFQDSERIYQRYYTDVPEDHSWALFAEALHDEGITFTRADCPKTDAGIALCPTDLVRKGDMARYLSEILAWELPATAVTPYTDISGNTLEARAIAYMQQNGLISELEPDCLPDEEGLQFCPNDYVNRAQTAVYLTNAFDGIIIEEMP